MKVLHGISDVPAGARGAVLAIGNFDGVHRGHQALLRAAMDEARTLGAPAGAMLFEPHPREFFQPDKPHFKITPVPRKLALLGAFGLDLAVVLRFDKALAALSPEDFIANVLVAGLGVAHVVVGYDFRFGKARAGDPELLQRAGAAHGFGVTVVAQVGQAGEVFSSSAIRAELAQGDVKGAAQMLGHWWRVPGMVIGGAKRGTGLGFPTANIALDPGTALAHGIYAVRVHLDGAVHPAAAYLGTRPTFDDGAPILEVFLLDFDGDLYGREIEVEFIDFVRADAKFSSADALKAQMDKDCAAARAILASAPPRPLRSEDSPPPVGRKGGLQNISEGVPPPLAPPHQGREYARRTMRPEDRGQRAATVARAGRRRLKMAPCCGPRPGRSTCELWSRSPEGVRCIPVPVTFRICQPKKRHSDELDQHRHARLERDPVPAQDAIFHEGRAAPARAQAAGALGQARHLPAHARKGQGPAPNSSCTTGRPTPTATSTWAPRSTRSSRTW